MAGTKLTKENEAAEVLLNFHSYRKISNSSSNVIQNILELKIPSEAVRFD
ncbi:hypothetical protein [Kordia jejudonensis]|nr:hypothetical protein [Kordia jejudonensis]